MPGRPACWRMAALATGARTTPDMRLPARGNRRLLPKGLPRKAAILGSLVPFVSIRLMKSANVATIRGKTTETMPTGTISTMNAVTTVSRQKSPCKRQFGF